LYILYNDNYFDNIIVENIERTTDNNDYPVPSQITLQLSHKDVNLGYFAYRQEKIDSLMSGRELLIKEEGCFLENTQVVKLSANFSKQVNELKEKGYFPVKASVRHIVFWKEKDKEKEIKIILPDVEFSK